MNNDKANNMQEPSLFDNDVFEITKDENQPVRCLGMEFESDDERREYFRNELRCRLPELRQIEGFPIGEDDDIIALSDPPYYTACPNPWLNDFIHQWEEEKRQLEAEGKRSKDFEVTEPYASDVSEGKNNPIYLYHSYLTKVPHQAVERYIKHYSQEGDIVYDGFCGSGMTGVATTMLGRKALCGDLSPLATFIAYSYLSGHKVDDFIASANRIIDDVEKDYSWMYKTLHTNGNYGVINYTLWSDVFCCDNCGNEYTYWKNSGTVEYGKPMDIVCPHCGCKIKKADQKYAEETVMDSALGKAITQWKTKPVLISYTYNGKRYEKEPDDKDLEVLARCEREMACLIARDGAYTQKIKYGDIGRKGNKERGYSFTHHFYTPRMYCILHSIKQRIPEPVFNVLVTKLSYLYSRLCRYRTSGGGGALSGLLYVPSISQEMALFRLLRKTISQRTCLKDIEGQHLCSISLQSATDSRNIANDTIDYIFTDPPFGGNLMYSEANCLSESWLRLTTNNGKEAIMNKSQQKGITEYHDLMRDCLREYYRILKPGKWMTVEFSNTSASVWNAIQNALQMSGFVIVSVSSLDKKQGSYFSVNTTTAVKQDLVITCYKPTAELTEKMQRSGDTAENVWDFVGELLLHLPIHLQRENKTTAVVERSPKILFDRMIAYYVQHGYPVPMDAQEFQQGLKERFVERDGMFFTADQAIEYDEKKLAAPEMAQLSLFVDSEQNGIAWLRRELTDKPQTYQDLQPKWMQALAATKKGDKLPEMMELLEDNFIKESDGSWRTPDPEKEADLEKLRSKKLLREFDHYAEQALLPKSKTMKEVRLEALRAGFKQCYKDKEFQKIISVAEKIPEQLLTEDEVLLQYYDIATTRI